MIHIMEHDVTAINNKIRKFKTHTSVTVLFDQENESGGEVTFFLKNDIDMFSINLNPTMEEFDE